MSVVLVGPILGKEERDIGDLPALCWVQCGHDVVRLWVDLDSVARAGEQSEQNAQVSPHVIPPNLYCVRSPTVQCGRRCWQPGPRSSFAYLLLRIIFYIVIQRN